MRKPIIAGNWKMNKTPSEAGSSCRSSRRWSPTPSATSSCAPRRWTSPPSARPIRGTNIKLGAQNVHWKESGAYTGELSAAMLKEAGCEYVVIGHSERRQYFGETDETVNLRTRAAVAAGLTPIICVGEKREQREAGYTDTLVAYQTLTALTGLTAEQVAKVVIAYEPVWAIGTGLTATDEQAQRGPSAVIREAVRSGLRRCGGRSAHPVRRQHEPQECARTDAPAADRRRPHRRRVAEGGGLLPKS